LSITAGTLHCAIPPRDELALFLDLGVPARPGAIAMTGFDLWLTETAQIANRWYGVDLGRVNRQYLWGLFADGVCSSEAAEFCKNVVDQRDVKRA
jgi:hypothetical protein